MRGVSRAALPLLLLLSRSDRPRFADLALLPIYVDYVSLLLEPVSCETGFRKACRGVWLWRTRSV